ncbi:epithelial splicing regulatory protein 1-like isoform X2 [Clavelina lepadiformis]|uniref:epithelial splicing regulatory protein 1-like isoform X2 n=1 Tax=Clavelina lepadiformis TaxID=159417 RepID=UPI004042048A
MGSSHYCDILVLFYCGTTGDNSSELLGSDESDLVVIVWQLLDLNQNQTGDIHYIYVKPSNDFCLRKEWQKETNITSQTLENAPVFQDAIHQFEETLRNELNDQGRTCSFTLCTDGQCHLRQVLMPASVWSDTTLPEFCYSFFDLKKEFRLCCNSMETDAMEIYNENYADTRTPDSVQDMLNYLNIDVESFGTFGVDHVRRMGAVIQVLVSERYGHVFNAPERIVARLDTGPCMTSELVRDDTVIRARGLPWQASDHDVARFFKGLNIPRGGAALVLNPQGRRNGEALVRFENEEQRDLALLRHKHHMGNRYIEVYRATGDDFLKVATGTSCEAIHFLSKEGDAIVRMRGLPFTATSNEIIEFFGSDIPVVHSEEGVLFVKHPDGRPTGDAFVLFASEKTALAALGKHKQTLGKRYVEIFKSTAAEVQQVLSRHMTTPIIPTMPAPVPLILPNNQQTLMSPHAQISPAYQQPITPGCIRNCIRLRGMPYSATVEDIMNFLGELSLYILPNGIHMVLNQQGRPSGDAFIQLCSPEKAGIAGLDVSKGGCHKKHMGERYVEVFQCSGDEMNIVLMGGTLNRNGMMPPPGMAIVPPEPVPTAGSITAIPAPTAPATSPFIVQTPHGTLLMQPPVVSQPGIPTLQTLDLIQAQTLLAAPRTAIYTQPTFLPYAQYLPTPPVSPSSANPIPATTPIANLTSPNSAAPAGTNPATGVGIQVRLQGMPYNAGVSDILTFLKGYNTYPAEVQQVVDPNFQIGLNNSEWVCIS